DGSRRAPTAGSPERRPPGRGGDRWFCDAMTRAQSMEVLRRLRKRSVVQGTADEGRFGLQGDAEGVFDTGDDRVREFDDVGGPRLSPVRQRQGVLVRQRRSPGPETESLGESRVF